MFNKSVAYTLHCCLYLLKLCCCLVGFLFFCPYVCVSEFMYGWMDVWMDVCICVYMCVGHVCVCMHVCVYV